MATTRRLTGVDGLRGLAAVGVVGVHVWMYTGPRTPGHTTALDAVIGEVRLGLMYFFVLSAFLMARPWARGEQPRLGRYVVQRAARVLPAYWVALAGAFAILWGTGHPRAIDAGQLPAFLLFAQNQVEASAGQLNPPTWSLAVEVGFYALLPLIGWALLRGRPLAICALVIAGGLGWSLLVELSGWPATATTSVLTYLPIFACGIAAAVLAQRHTVSRRGAVALLVAGWALVVANGYWHSGGATGLLGHVVRDLPAGVGFAAIVLGVTARPARVLDFPPIRWLGTVSYGTYLWHMPILYWLKTRDLFPEDPLTAYVAVLGPALLLGALSWRLIEQPVLRAVSARRDRRSSPRRTPARPWRAGQPSRPAAQAARS
ncbi:MAG TPA: acyltransferase [Solirubrobacteraceae bacterium]